MYTLHLCIRCCNVAGGTDIRVIDISMLDASRILLSVRFFLATFQLRSNDLELSGTDICNFGNSNSIKTLIINNEQLIQFVI